MRSFATKQQKPVFQSLRIKYLSFPVILCLWYIRQGTSIEEYFRYKRVHVFSSAI